MHSTTSSDNKHTQYLFIALVNTLVNLKSSGLDIFKTKQGAKDGYFMCGIDSPSLKADGRSKEESKRRVISYQLPMEYYDCLVCVESPVAVDENTPSDVLDNIKYLFFKWTKNI